tara:strand:- start:17394 stop:17687 length:294 start_codon:yes stop_codon:yes gene_type:complete
MGKINVKKLGMAFGLTGVFLYLGCIIVMATVGREGTIKFFNSLLHGLDVSNIIRMDIPLWEAGIGLVQTFVIAWLIGACVAMFYNISFNKKTDQNNM